MSTKITAVWFPSQLNRYATVTRFAVVSLLGVQGLVLRRSLVLFVGLFLGLSLGLGGAACTTSAEEIREARQSAYMADFAIVYGAALDATKEIYPNITEDAQRQLIQTAWHPLKLSTGAVDDSQTTITGGTKNAFGQVSSQRTRYYVRFRVFILGGQPFRVRIEGEASQWEQGEVPSPLRGAAVPSWLEARTDTLRVKIHKKLKKHAIEMASTAKVTEERPEIPLKDAATFGEIPRDAATVIALVLQAAEGRDISKLRLHLTGDIEWAQGSRGVDAAVAIWAADPSQLAELGLIVDGGCAKVADGVVCPAEASSEGYTGRIARFRRNGQSWKMVSFY